MLISKRLDQISSIEPRKSTGRILPRAQLDRLRSRPTAKPLQLVGSRRSLRHSHSVCSLDRRLAIQLARVRGPAGTSRTEQGLRAPQPVRHRRKR